MAGKVINSSLELLSKFGTNRQESTSKTATSHIRKPLAAIPNKHLFKMKLQKEHIIKFHERLVDFIQENLLGIEALNIEENEEINSTYLGLLLRQLTLNSDLALLLEKKKHIYHTSQLILLRCLIDDFMHIVYIANQANPDELIVNYNADAYAKNFQKLKDLATLNEEKLGGDYPHYPTYKMLNEVADKMKKNPLRNQYLSDIENFKFKTFKNTGNIIRDLTNEVYAHQLKRAYFIWRKLSDFVHYSNMAFNEEQTIDPGNDYTYNEFAEIIFYSYRTSMICLSHFHNKHGLEIVDKHKLAEYYAEAGH